MSEALPRVAKRAMIESALSAAGAADRIRAAVAAESVLVSLPAAVACMIFALLPCADNRRLATCAWVLRRVAHLKMASPDAVRVTDFAGADCSTVIATMATVTDTMLPRHLTVHYKFYYMDSMGRVCGMTTLRSLALYCTPVPQTWRLSDLTQLTDLTFCPGWHFAPELVAVIAECTTLVRLHLEYSGDTDKLSPLSALTRLERVTLQSTSVDRRKLFLIGLPALTELCLLRDPSGGAFPMPDELGDWATRLRRLTLQGQLSRNCFRSLVPLASTLVALDFAYDNTELPLRILWQLARLEELVLRYPPAHVRHNPPTLEEFAVLARLRALRLHGAALRDLTGFELLAPSLAELHLEDCLSLASLSGLSTRIALRKLSAVRCHALQNVRGLALMAPSLTALTFTGNVATSDPPQITGHNCLAAHVNPLTQLTALRLDNCYNAPPLCTRLRRLAFGTDACPRDYSHID